MVELCQHFVASLVKALDLLVEELDVVVAISVPLLCLTDALVEQLLVDVLGKVLCHVLSFLFDQLHLLLVLG